MKKREPFRKVTLKKGVVKRMLSYVFKRYYKHFIVVVFLILISSFVNVASSIFLQKLIDDYITPLIGVTRPNFMPIIELICIMIGIYLVGIISTFVYSIIMIVISQGTLNRIRNEIFLHMQKLPLGYFYKHEYGDTMSIYTNDTDTLREMIGRSFPQVISSIITIIAVFLAMIFTSIHLTVLVIAVIWIMFFITKFITKNGSKYFLAQQNSIGKIDGFIEEMINGQKVVKAFSYEDEVKKRFNSLNEELCKNSTEANGYVNILMPIMGNISNIQYVLIAILGGILAIHTNFNITLGAIASFLQLSKTISAPINQISGQVNSVVVALAGAERIFDLLDYDIEKDEGYISLVNARFGDGVELVETQEKTDMLTWKDDKGKLTYVRGNIEFINVNFGYSKDNLVLKNFSFTAKQGQKIALIGATGAGKTTIANLLNRFYDIDSGEILYDGINIKNIKKDSLRKSIGMVLQDTNLFTGTIMENIRYGNLDASDEQVYSAAKLAYAHDFIEKLPDGYETKIDNNGEELSEGQRKLIAIAQAIVSNAPVMILDEATSSIDTRTEKLVQKGMDELMRRRTSFVIAHRLQTVYDADVILVIKNGEIIEKGKHQELLKNKGLYYNLYTGAFLLE